MRPTGTSRWIARTSVRGTRALRTSARAAVAVGSALLLAALLALAARPGPVRAAAASVPSAAQAASAKPPIVREEGVRWQSLSPAQKQALAPLEREWPQIEGPRKQKWIALAARFDTLPPAERARITERMVEWAKLTPAERGQARLRYEESKAIPSPERSARWQQYQALPPETKAQLAARAASAAAARTVEPGRRDAGAKTATRVGRDGKEAKANLVPNPALAQPPRQVAPTLVQAAPGATTTPITRAPMPPAHQQTGMPKIAATSEYVSRNTLLPKRGPQAVTSTKAAASAASAAAPQGAGSAPVVAVLPASAPSVGAAAAPAASSASQ